MNQHEIDHLRALIAAHRQRLHVLELRAARFGWESPPQVLNEIAEIQGAVEQIERQLASNTLPSYESGKATLGTAGARIAALDRRYLFQHLRRAALPGLGLLVLALALAALFAARGRATPGDRPTTPNLAALVSQEDAPTQAATFTPTPSPTRTPSPTALPRWPIEVAGTALVDGAHVAHTLTLLGTYPTELPEAHELWIFIKTPGGQYFPQSHDVCAGQAAPRHNGRWEMRVGIGSFGQSDVGKIFEILVTTATPDIGRGIGDIVKEWCRRKNFPGLFALPPGLVVERAVKIIRTAEQIALPPSISRAELPGELTITSPISGTVALRSPVVTGTFANIGAARIWVLIHPINGRWYPQSENPCTHLHTQTAAQTWSVSANLGGAANRGEPFDIVVVLADADADAFFDAKQAEWCAAGNAPGLLTIELPPGLTQQAHIRVIRE